ncbi:hypothetical protein [Amycolatopsis sp.]|uniref:hypothetical protein n=1 Tax=Amycolatopsis sp. TaxID=37632 RepID=UPI002D8076D5|nr:hypothetical protein [Amycolatopsis sp.]HET6708924.1 hypothetical protein [Amycolatopsis sp.]
MRLVRLERQQSRVADDIRAALASLGRGSTVIGGIALVGVGGVTDRPIEAVVLLPHGVIIVIGVDLPDPALRLEAPLGGPWKADGWPLVADDDSVNPATEALDVSQACERRIAALVPGTAPVGTIIAVGPYVETVDQPVSDLAGPVRVLHPTPTTMLAATVSLATAHRPRSVDQVRALIRGLAPSAPEFSDEVLLGEGFSRLTDDSPPESLWDDGSGAGEAEPGDAAAAVPAPTPTPAAAVAPATAVPGPATPEQAVPAAAVVPATAVSGPATPEQAPRATAGTTDWRTETPAEAKPKPTAPEPAIEPELSPTAETTSPPAEVHSSPAEEEPARPVFPGAETPPADPTDVHPSPAEPEPDHPADPPAPPIFPGTEPPAPPAGRTEALPSPAETEPDHPVSPPAPVFPGTEPPAPADSAAAETERTENLSLPAPGSNPIEAVAPPSEPEQAPEHPAPRSGKAEPAGLRPSAPDFAAEAGHTPDLTAPRPGEAEPADRPAAAVPAPDLTAPRPGKTEPADRPAAAVPAPDPTAPRPGKAAPHPAAAENPEPSSPPRLPLPSAGSPQPFPRPRPKPESTAATPRTVRWVPLGAIGALVVLVVAAIAVATIGDGTAAAPAPPPATVSQAPPATTPVRSLQFALRAAAGDQRCASHAFGDAQTSLQQTSCAGVKRASYAATVDGRAGAVTVGIVDFPDAGQAAAFKAVADTPGGGGILDLATETGQWGATPTPRFENAAYASKLDGSSVRLVQAVWAPGPSTPDDPGLVRAAKAALDLPAR